MPTHTSQHQPGKLDRFEGIRQVTIHLSDSGHCTDRLIFSRILVQSEFKLGINTILNDTDLS